MAGWDLALSGELGMHICASLRRLVIGFVLGAVPGIFIGMVMGLNRWVRAALDPLVAALYPIPKIAHPAAADAGVRPGRRLEGRRWWRCRSCS